MDKHIREIIYTNGTRYPDIRYESTVTGVTAEVADAMLRRFAVLRLQVSDGAFDSDDCTGITDPDAQPYHYHTWHTTYDGKSTPGHMFSTTVCDGCGDTRSPALAGQCPAAAARYEARILAEIAALTGGA